MRLSTFALFAAATIGVAMAADVSIEATWGEGGGRVCDGCIMPMEHEPCEGQPRGFISTAVDKAYVGALLWCDACNLCAARGSGRHSAACG